MFESRINYNSIGLWNWQINIYARLRTPLTKAAVPVSTPTDEFSSEKAARLPLYTETNASLRAEFI